MYEKNQPYVDIILPNYNKNEFLEEAINSIIKQSYKNWYLYIIDDCSNDNSWSTIEKFSNLQNVKRIKLSKNMGPSFCRNYGMRLSKSKYISFIDSDDSWTLNKLEKQISEFTLNTVQQCELILLVIDLKNDLTTDDHNLIKLVRI